MADEILRSKHAFGSSENLENAKSQGLVNEYDLLMLDGSTDDPKFGWIDKDGNTVIIKNQDVILVKGDSLPDTGKEEVIYIFNSTLYYWNGKEFVASVCDNGVSEADMNEKIEAAVSDANAYSDKKLDSALEAYVAEKFEFVGVPEGTLVNYYDNEIRVMCPNDCVWSKQNVGTGGDPNCYYATFNTYFLNDDVTGYIEHLGDKSDAEILTDIKVDEYGRRYQTTWLSLAKFDETTNSWNYYGATSNEEKFIGWDYRIDQYNSDGKMIASDSVRINLSNEDCHFSTTPFYMGSAMSGVVNKIDAAVDEANAYTDKKIAEVVSGFEIVEF